MEADFKVDVPASVAKQRLVRHRETADVLIDIYYPLRSAAQILVGSLLLGLALHQDASSWSVVLLGGVVLFALLTLTSFVTAVVRSRKFWVVSLDDTESSGVIDRCAKALNTLGWQTTARETSLLVATPTVLQKEPARVVTIVASENRLLFNSRRAPHRKRRAFCHPEEVRTDLLALLGTIGSGTILSGPHGKGAG